MTAVEFENPDKTFEEQANRVHSFYQACADVRDRYQKGECDSRRVNLNKVCMAANASQATLRLLHWARQGGEEALVAALGLTKPEYINFVAEDLLRASRLHLLVETQFQIETLFRNILGALGKPQGKGFYNIANEVLKVSGVTDTTAKLATLNVPALLRNSMHSNGIHHGHNGSSTSTIVESVEFCFQHGKRVQSASWFHIVTALNGALGVVENVLASTPVAGLNM